jgi:hypothetical protein
VDCGSRISHCGEVPDPRDECGCWSGGAAHRIADLGLFRASNDAAFQKLKDDPGFVAVASAPVGVEAQRARLDDDIKR